MLKSNVNDVSVNNTLTTKNNNMEKRMRISRGSIKEKLEYIIDNFDPNIPVKEQSVTATHYLNAIKQLRELYDIDKKTVKKEEAAPGYYTDMTGGE